MELAAAAPATRIGVDDESWPHMEHAEALALLHLFDAQDAERRALSAKLVAVPDGRRLYITPRIGF